MNKKRALITGITGQDGSYLAEFLLKKGYEVHGIVRRSSTFNRERIDHLTNPDSFFSPEKGNITEPILHYADLTDSSSIEKIISLIIPNEVYNLAAQSHVGISFEVPENTTNIVAEGTLRLLEAIRKICPNSKFYQASSSEMFGKVEETPQNEKTRFHPRSPYACAKVYAHCITINFREAYNMFTCSGILFNHESERRGHSFVTRKITRSLARIKMGLQKTLQLGNLDAERDWGYAPDFVEAMWLMLQQEKPDDYVIGTGEKHSVREFLEETAKVLGLKIKSNNKKGVEEKYLDENGNVIVKINPVYLRPSEVDTLQADCSKAKNKLKWEPKTTFKEITRKMALHDLKLAQKEASLNNLDKGDIVDLNKNGFYGHFLENCRMCNSKDLYEFLDLGFFPPADGILSLEEINQPEVLFPLRICQCQKCGLTQLTYAVNPKILYGEKYRYESSITETGKKHFFEMAESITKKFNLKKNSFIIDIGSNVGVLLEGFKNNGMNVLGIDPAQKIAKIANKRGIETWQEFMNPKVAKEIVSKKGKVKVITGTNIFAHIDNKNDLIESIKIMLDEKGVFIIEVPYFLDLLEKLEYDTIYLDHLEYESIKPLVKFFDKHGLDLFDVEKYEIHGKSIRVFVCKKGEMPISENVNKFLKLEEEKGIYKKEILDEFARKVAGHREKTINLLRDLKRNGYKIAGISAPAKGNTLLNYCKIGTNIIEFLAEKSEIKKGCYSPGMHLPILDEEELINQKIDFGVIFAWNFADEIIKNNQKFAENGGKFIILIPEPIIK